MTPTFNHFLLGLMPQVYMCAFFHIYTNCTKHSEIPAQATLNDLLRNRTRLQTGLRVPIPVLLLLLNKKIMSGVSLRTNC